jgi:hypothetical protein
MSISNTSLTLATANIYVSSGNTVVSVMYFCNTDSAARNLNVYLMPRGTATANAAVQIYKDVQIAAGDTLVVDMEKLVLSDGDMIRASATAANVITATVSYVGI